MKTRSAIVYSVLRLLVFLVPLGIMMLFPIFRDMYWIALIFATLIGISLSIIFLRRPLNDVSQGLAERRAARTATHAKTAAEQDADIENAANDAARGVADPATDAAAPAPSEHGAPTQSVPDAGAPGQTVPDRRHPAKSDRA
ncbi:hypothetical protein GCM10022240_17550 [Microbacterium kribbense]|uniref:DUF4229 domain-containing protein n=1 Tax=Microbacterium kribbense TaxID=433645 RepID=A0ABP7GKJ3_9MICO